MTTLTRRTVLAGACGTCAVAVASCAAYGPASAPAPSAAPAPAPSGGTGGGDAAPAGSIQTSAVPVGGGIILADQGAVVTQPTKDTFKAFSSVCTHQGCAVGSVEKGEIICPCHGSTFAVADGSVINGPATQPLAAKKVTVKGTALTIA